MQFNTARRPPCCRDEEPEGPSLQDRIYGTDPEFLSGAKKVLYGAVAANTEREFVVACISAIWPWLTRGLLFSAADAIDDATEAEIVNWVRAGGMVVTWPGAQAVPDASPIGKVLPVTMGDVTIGRTEYRFRGDTSRVAFTESTFRLATDTNSPSVARSMVDVAEARNWKALRVSGNEDFKRMVWLEASVRGVKTLGYEPNPGDLEVLKREREARQVNRIEPARGASSGAAAAPTEKTPSKCARLSKY